MDARGGIYCTPKRFQNLLPGTSKILGITPHNIQGILSIGVSVMAKMQQAAQQEDPARGRRNRLNSILFPDPKG
jgi:thiamine monophosphate synthase